MKTSVIFLFGILVFQNSYTTENNRNKGFDIEDHYTKYEYNIPVRDGVKLFTAVYVPKDTSVKYPVILYRTPYSIAPYGTDNFPEFLGPSKYFTEEKYIFVYQDVRGMFMSEGTFFNMTPHIPDKRRTTDIDNSTDTYDTVEWILKNIRNNNGRVGLWGISYPGFNVSSGIIDTHPAIKCASPQAPVADWFVGEDMHHNGAFALLPAFNFCEAFSPARHELTVQWPEINEYPVKDAYNFFLNSGTISEMDEKYINTDVPLWDSIMIHGTYDNYWKRRNLLPNLRDIKCAVMTVCGWFDAENLYGSVNTYKSIEANNPGIYNIFVSGPWIHGGWARTPGNKLGDIDFGDFTSVYYQEEIELKFFNYFLKDKGELNLPEVLVFETGTNTWKEYDKWPPENTHYKSLYFHEDNGLKFTMPENKGFQYDEYISDPGNPVPYTAVFQNAKVFYNKEFMTEDQRFAASRPDVLYYQTDILDEDITVYGPVQAEIYVSTTGTDADWVVKLIDVFPDEIVSTVWPRNTETSRGGYQMLVRAEILRGKFRKSYEKPEPHIPGKVERIAFDLKDVNHTFRKGHRIMVQVQSSMFPLFDRNPQKFCNIYNAGNDDYQKATQRIYRSNNYSSNIILNILD
jgi:putative CocE/NonD family hydrolase